MTKEEKIAAIKAAVARRAEAARKAARPRPAPRTAQRQYGRPRKVIRATDTPEAMAVREAAIARAEAHLASCQNPVTIADRRRLKRAEAALERAKTKVYHAPGKYESRESVPKEDYILALDQMHEEGYHSPAEIAILYGTTVNTVFLRIRKGFLPCKRVDRYVFVSCQQWEESSKKIEGERVERGRVLAEKRMARKKI